MRNGRAKSLNTASCKWRAIYWITTILPKFKQSTLRPAFQPQLSTLGWSKPSTLLFANWWLQQVWLRRTVATDGCASTRHKTSQKTNYICKSNSACWLAQIHGPSRRVWHVRGENRVWLGQYEGKKPLGRHTRVQNNIKTGSSARTGLNWLSMGRSIGCSEDGYEPLDSAMFREFQ
jgi:hypothetical protein